MRLLAVFALGLALLFISAGAQARPIYGSPPIISFSCPYGSGLGDGCEAGASYQQANFFTGYANQSAGVSSGAPVNLQPASYTVRPAWNVAGVDFPVGIKANVLASGLKDPANIASDTLANPDGAGADCNYLSGAANTVGPYIGQGPAVYCFKSGGALTAPEITGYDFSLHGCTPLFIGSVAWSGTVKVHDNLFANGVNCDAPYEATTAAAGDGAHATLSVTGWYYTSIPAVAQYVTVEGVSPSGYNGTYAVTAVSLAFATAASANVGSYVAGGALSYSTCSAALYGVVGTGSTVTFKVKSWPTACGPPANGATVTVTGVSPSAYNGSYTLASVSIPSVTYANSTTGAQTSAGTVYHLGSAAFAMMTTTSATTAFPTLIYNNTVFGCGADTQQALEAAKCLQNFPNTPSFAGQGAPIGPGTVPYFLDMHWFVRQNCGQLNVQYNAIIHMPGRGIQDYCSFGSSGSPQVYTISQNYIEGLVYPGDGEHGEFIEYGGRVNGLATLNEHYNVFLQTSHVASESEANLYWSTGSKGGTANITSISCVGTACAVGYGGLSGTSILGVTNIINGSTTPGDNLTLSGTGDANFDGQTFTANTVTSSVITITCLACSSADSASAVTNGIAYSHLATFQGENDHNIYITNLNPSLSPYWTTDIDAIAFSYNIFGAISVHDNWLDPTGAALCFYAVSSPTLSPGPTFTNNKSLLGSIYDASSNQFSSGNGSCGGSQTH